MSNIFDRKKLVKSMSQAPNLERLLFRSEFESQHKNHEVKNCGKNYVSCSYLFKAYINLNELIKLFCRKTLLTVKVVIYLCCYLSRMQRRIYTRNGMSSERANNIYRRNIRQPQYQQLAVEEHLRACRDGKFHMFLFFKILQENKSLSKSYEVYFIDKFKPLLNKKVFRPKYHWVETKYLGAVQNRRWELFCRCDNAFFLNTTAIGAC